jgi:hypothetical protein
MRTSLSLAIRGALVGGGQLSSFPVQVTIQCVLVRLPCYLLATYISNEPTTWNLIPTTTTRVLLVRNDSPSCLSSQVTIRIPSLPILTERTSSLSGLHLSRTADYVNEPQLWMPISSGPSMIDSTTNARLELSSMSHLSPQVCSVLSSLMLIASSALILTMDQISGLETYYYYHLSFKSTIIDILSIG